MKKKNTN